MHALSLFFLCLLAAILPWEENFYISQFVSTATLLGLAVFVLGMLKILFSGRMRAPPVGLIFFALFIGWCLLAEQWSIDPERTFVKAKTYLQLFVFVWLVWELADTPARQKWIMRAIVFGTAVLVFNVILNHFGTGLHEQQRATAENANPNGVAFACVTGFQFALFLITRREKGRFEIPNWCYWGFIAAAGITIPLTGSRAGAIAAIPAAITFWPVLSKAVRNASWKNALMLLLIVAVIGLGAARFTSGDVRARLMEGLQAHTFQERVDAWARGLDAWKKAPLTGVGPGTYQIVNLSSGEGERVAHNTFVSVLVETGIVGFILYFSFWALIIRRIFRLRKEDRFFWLVFITSLVPCMLTGSTEYSKFWWLVGALVLCQSANPTPVNGAYRRSRPYPIRTAGPPTRPLGPSRAQ